MMSMNPSLAEMMIQTRMAEMRQAAVTRSAIPRRAAFAGSGTADPTLMPRTTTRPAKARRAIGWFLVGLGLRLAVSRPRSASAQ